MKSALKVINCIIVVILTLQLQSCFTGIESTPKISKSEVRKQTRNNDALYSFDEEKIASELAPYPPSKWRAGDKFIVCDNKIGLTFPSAPETILPNAGDTILFAGFAVSRNVLGEETTTVRFLNQKSDTLAYKINFPLAKINERSSLEIPFTIPLTMVEKADSLLTGMELFVNTTYRYKNSDGTRIDQNKFQPVRITSVKSGSVEQPFRVFFTEKSGETEKEFFLPMTTGASRTSTRNFTALFSMKNPRSKYPDITDETWSFITASKVKPGMTRQECRLAIGSPSEVLHGHSYSSVYERWIYQDGRNLIFEDGLLKGIR